MNELPFATLENEFLRIDYLTSLGPRIIGLYSKEAGTQLFAKTPEAHWPTPHGEYYLHGGHRLWISPEDPFYMCPEDHVHVSTEGNRVALRSNVDASGLEKEISLRLDGNTVTVAHRLTWHGNQPIELAPWALTQMQLGGMAILPQSVTDTGLLPNRNLVLWPYSQLRDDRLELHDDLVLIHGRAAAHAFKVGNYNPYGWVAYALDRVLFVKRFATDDTLPYSDKGCNAESYVRDTFLELETLGYLTTIKPGETVVYDERWEVTVGDYAPNVESARTISREVSQT